MATSESLIIDFLPAEIDEHYRVEVEVVGDLAHTLWMLNERLDAAPAAAWDLSQQSSVREQMIEEFAINRDDDTSGRVRPQKVLWDVRAALGPDDVLLSDVGAHKMWIARLFPVPRAEHLPDPQRVLLHGVCPTRLDRKLGSTTRSQNARHLRRRRIHDERPRDGNR